MKHFFIISIKYSKGDHVVFWRANASGYTSNINEAGRYTESQVNKNPDYYNNGEDTVAIEVDELERHFTLKRVADVSGLAHYVSLTHG